MATEYVPVAELDELQEDGRDVVSAGGHSVALFHHEGEVYAVDNRCPHMGFPLSKGTVDDGLLTCHWHHARFELACGDTFDVWADDVQTFPTEIRDGQVYLDPDPEPDVPPATRWRNRLVDGMQENLGLVVAKSVINLDAVGAEQGEGPTSENPPGARKTSNASLPVEPRARNDPRAEGFQTPLETAVTFGTKYRSSGWGRGLTTLCAMANLYDDVAHDEKLRALYVGIGSVADDCTGEPPRFAQYQLGNTELSTERLKSWFRETCEVRDEDGAERCLRTAANVLPPEEVTEIVVAAATDHLYMNASHTLDFVNKAFETLDHIGWEHAEEVLGSVVPVITDASRSEETSAWRQPIDVAELCFDAYESLDDLVAAGAGKTWERPDGFVDTLLTDDPEVVVDALRDAITAGATSEQLSRAVALAATRRVAQFATSNEFSDWDTVHHTFSYTNAAYQLSQRTDAVEVYRACFDGAMSVYLDRFLNQPAAPIPVIGDGGTGADPKAIRDQLLASFDEHGEVEAAAGVVNDHFEAGGDATDLKRTLGEGLLREDAGFHALQNVEAAFQQFDVAETERERRLALIATARYLSAHFPTQREREQTFTIARRLHRGEAVHGES